jgi:type IV pilus assembly protein PilA
MSKIFRPKQKGFTLVELMIVVAIIGILAAIAIPQFQVYRSRGFMATVRSDTKNFHTAVQAYIAENLRSDPRPVDTFGPTAVPDYPPARVSALVRIRVNSAGDVTGSHDALGGTYTIMGDGAVIDSLSVQ